MRSTNSFLLLAIAILLSSCLTHFFAEPVPIDAKEYPSMPKPLIGKWHKENEEHTIDKISWSSQWVDSLGNKKMKVEYELSDSLMVKKVGKNYYINSLETNGYWTVYLGSKRNSLFMIMGLGKSDTLTLKNVLGVTPDSIYDSNELYYNTLLSKRQMKKFVKNGGFSDTLIVFDIKNRTLRD